MFLYRPLVRRFRCAEAAAVIPLSVEVEQRENPISTALVKNSYPTVASRIVRVRCFFRCNVDLNAINRYFFRSLFPNGYVSLMPELIATAIEFSILDLPERSYFFSAAFYAAAKIQSGCSVRRVFLESDNFNIANDCTRTISIFLFPCAAAVRLREIFRAQALCGCDELPPAPTA